MKRAAFIGGVLTGIGLTTLAVPFLTEYAHHGLYENGIYVSDKSLSLLIVMLAAGLVLMIAGGVIAFYSSWPRRPKANSRTTPSTPKGSQL